METRAAFAPNAFGDSLLFGLAPDGVFRTPDVTVEAVSFYLAFSPLPPDTLCWGWRFVFCGTVRFRGINRETLALRKASCPVESGLSSPTLLVSERLFTLPKN